LIETPLPGEILAEGAEVRAVALGGRGTTVSVTSSAGTALVDLDPDPRIFRAALDVDSLPAGELELTARATDAYGRSVTATRSVQVPQQVVPGETARVADPALPITFVSAGGEAEVSIPPFALQVLATPELEPLPRAEAPLPGEDEVLLGAVRAEPEGLQFAVPVMLRFPIEGLTLPPGSAHPLSLYDPATASWGETGTDAVVTDAGTHFEAQVTHFSLYGVRTSVSNLPFQPSPPTFGGVAAQPVFLGRQAAVSLPLPVVSTVVGVSYEVAVVNVVDAVGTPIPAPALTAETSGSSVTIRNADTLPHGSSFALDVLARNALGQDLLSIDTQVCQIALRPIFLLPGYNMSGAKFRGDSFPLVYGELEPDGSPGETHLLYDALVATGRPVFLLDLPNADGLVEGTETSCVSGGNVGVCVPAEGAGLTSERLATRGDVLSSAVSAMHQIEAVLDYLDGETPGGDYFSCAPRQVDLVGYSTGGVTARYAAEYLQQDASFHIANLVAVAAPLGGVSSSAFLANFFIPPYDRGTWSDIAPMEMWRLNPYGHGDDPGALEAFLGCEAEVPAVLDAQLQQVLTEWNTIACDAVGIEIGTALRLLDDALPFPDLTLAPLGDALADALDAITGAGGGVAGIIPLLEAVPIPVHTRVTSVYGTRFDPSDWAAGLLDWPLALIQGTRPLDQILVPYDVHTDYPVVVGVPQPTERVRWDGTVNESSARLAPGEALSYQGAKRVDNTLHAQVYNAILPDRWAVASDLCVAEGAHHMCDLGGQALRCAIGVAVPGLTDGQVDVVATVIEDALGALVGDPCRDATSLAVAAANGVIFGINLGIPDEHDLDYLSAVIDVPEEIRINHTYRPIWSSCDPEAPVPSVLRVGLEGDDDNACDWVLNNEEVNGHVVEALGSGWLMGSRGEVAATTNPVTEGEWLDLFETCLRPHPRDPLGNHERIQGFLQQEDRRRCVNGSLQPTADAGDDVTVADAGGNGSEIVVLDGSASSDLDGSIVSYSWTTPTLGALGTGPVLAYDFPLGSHTVTLLVQDDAGGIGVDTVQVHVVGICGDGGVNAPGEQCDSPDLGSGTCSDLGFDFTPPGQLSCDSSCTYSSADCCPAGLVPNLTTFTGNVYDAGGSLFGSAQLRFLAQQLTQGRCNGFRPVLTSPNQGGLSLSFIGGVTSGDSSSFVLDFPVPFTASAPVVGTAIFTGTALPPAAPVGCITGTFARGTWIDPTNWPESGSYVVCR
jgi:hypothetical protein